MRRQNIDHILRAAADATGQTKFVLVGSGAVIARLKQIPLNMMYTPEIDIYAPDAGDVEAISEIIDGSIGQLSRFHQTFGYYGDGVSPSTAKMPVDWPARTVEYRPAERPDIVAIVPDQNDVALAKLAAWREKDQAWLAEAARASVISLKAMLGRLGQMPAPNSEGIPPGYDVLKARLQSLASQSGLDLAP